MQSCCLEGCESYKYSSKQKIAYFKFPIHNKALLNKWLNQIMIPNWQPSEEHKICSTHFHVDDIDFSNKNPKLKNNAIPMIFPLKHFQTVYVNEICSDPVESIKKKANIPNKIQSKKRNSLGNSENIHHNIKKPSSMVLLCTPTKQSGNIADAQINSLTSSNLCMKKIPLKNENAPDNKSELTALNPYILIISDNKEKKIPIRRAPVVKQQAILRIQIDKKIDDIIFDESEIESADEQSDCNQINVIDEQNTNGTNHVEEVTVDDVSCSKIVVFKFDTSTGKISVVKKDKLKKNKKSAFRKESNSREQPSGNLKSLENNSTKNFKTIETTKENSIIQQKNTENNPNSSIIQTVNKSANNDANEIEINSEKNDNIVNLKTLSTKENSTSLVKDKISNSNLSPLTNNLGQKRQSDVIINVSEDESERSASEIKKGKLDVKNINTILEQKKFCT